MQIVVAVLGVLIVLTGVLGLAAPQRFRSMLGSMPSQFRFQAAVIMRLVVGALLWMVADELRFPTIIRIIAAIGIFAAVVILIMGRARLNRFVDWWLSLSDGWLRLSLLFAAAFGGFLVYVAT